MIVVAGGDNHRVDLLAHLVEHHTVVLELGHVGKFREAHCGTLLVDVTHGDDVAVIEERAVLAFVGEERGTPAAAAH